MLEFTVVKYSVLYLCALNSAHKKADLQIRFFYRRLYRIDITLLA